MAISQDRAGRPVDLLNSFLSGETSKSFWGAISSKIYTHGAKELNNFIVLPSGGIRKRLGTKYLYSSTDKELYTIDGFNVDVVFRSKLQGSEYFIYDGSDIAPVWTPNIISVSELQNSYNNLSSDGKKILFTTKTGIFSIEKATGAFNQETITGNPSTPITDYTNSIIFNNSLFIIEPDKFSVSKVGDLFNFDTSQTGISNAFQQVSNVFDKTGAEITNVIPYKDVIIITTTAGIFGLSKFTLGNSLVVWKTYPISTHVVAKNCIVTLNSHIFYTTDSGLWTFASNVNSGANLDTRTGVDNFETILLSAYASHVFDVPIIKLSKRKKDTPSILYGLRKDGIIINFTIHPQMLVGERIVEIAVSRREIEGDYVYISSNFMSSLISERFDENGNRILFAEKEIFNTFTNDNKIINLKEDNLIMQNYSYYDCCDIKNGYRNETAHISTNGLLLTVLDSKFTYVAGTKIELDSNQAVTIVTVSITDSITNITIDKPVKDFADKSTVKINGVYVNEVNNDIFTSTKPIKNAGYSYINFGDLYTHKTSSIESNATANKGIHVVAGIGFNAFVRMLPSSYFFQKVTFLSALLTTVDTNILLTSILEEGGKVVSRETYIDLLTGSHRVDIPSLGEQQHMNYEYYIHSKIGHNAIILNVNYEISDFNMRDF